MPTCHKCRKKMKPGFKDLTFKENKNEVLVKNIPAFICSACGESRIKGSVAEYVHTLVDTLTQIQLTSKTGRKQISIKEIALSP